MIYIYRERETTKSYMLYLPALGIHIYTERERKKKVEYFEDQ
jgi:hypothetical protein